MAGIWILNAMNGILAMTYTQKPATTQEPDGNSIRRMKMPLLSSAFVSLRWQSFCVPIWHRQRAWCKIPISLVWSKKRCALCIYALIPIYIHTHIRTEYRVCMQRPLIAMAKSQCLFVRWKYFQPKWWPNAIKWTNNRSWIISIRSIISTMNFIAPLWIFIRWMDGEKNRRTNVCLKSVWSTQKALVQKFSTK